VSYEDLKRRDPDFIKQYEATDLNKNTDKNKSVRDSV
jgi:hypothetical protein